MKVLYSQLKEFVPKLRLSPKDSGEILTRIGFLLDGFEEVIYREKKDYLLSFEIRQNRPDCLSVLGLAKELAAYLDQHFVPPSIKKNYSKNSALNIEVNTEKSAVRRILAIKLDGVRNQQSPGWLKKYLKLQGTRSVNLAVDISNYVMFLTGYPSHLLDESKINGALKWATNTKERKVVTLDGTPVTLFGGELVIEDAKEILALAGLVGCKKAEISENTYSLIVEMAVYDKSHVSKDSRSLKIITEAGIRLTKELDPNGLDYAHRLLVKLLCEHLDAKPASALFEYYPKKPSQYYISFDPTLPSLVAGVPIKKTDVKRILNNLGFLIKEKSQGIWRVTSPVSRTDIDNDTDLAEEVIRIYGYENIPNNQPPALSIAQNITPGHIAFHEKVEDDLTTLGFDEIRSWPLVQEADNNKMNYKSWDKVSTQNSINEEYPELRQTMLPGLVKQYKEYKKKNIEFIRIFEIGKIFGRIGKKYYEKNSLGLLYSSSSDEKHLNAFQGFVETTLLNNGLHDIGLNRTKQAPEISNLLSSWEIHCGKKRVGLISKLDLKNTLENVYVAEIDLDEAYSLFVSTKEQTTFELEKKVIQLDNNIEILKTEDINQIILNIQKKIGKRNFWDIRIIDKFPRENKIRYTLRITYRDLSDTEAKKLHNSIF